ncbi:MAG TPA: glutamate ABC transporter substrate-binding protein [Pedococcus sp.]|nr:glutamate ABC transporter substrate-binding protein [Pedococcus sp.]
MSRRRPHPLVLLTLVVASLGAAGCTAAGTYDPTPLYTPSPSPSSSSSSATPTPGPSGRDIVSTNCLQTFAPPETMPAPGRMPAGSHMRTIQERGKLVAGVSADSLLLGARDPVSNDIEGFDIDLLHAISQAIFGDPDQITYRVITADEREGVLQDKLVDIVARNMTINCARWGNIAFSSEYYRDGQKILVRQGETTDAGGRAIRGLEDLAGRKVCAPIKTTSLTRLQTFEDVEAVTADSHTGCLVLFQEGGVDAITGDATVLAGLASQDPYAVVVQAPAFSAEPFGLGINRAHVDFVRFVNGVLEQMRADGRWARSYNTWFAPSLGKAPAPPEPVYGRAP